MKVTDWVSLGMLPLRDHNPQARGRFRNVLMGCRTRTPGGAFSSIAGPWPGRDKFGAPWPETLDLGGDADTQADINCANLWESDPKAEDDRGIAGWIFGPWATKITSVGETAEDHEDVDPITASIVALATTTKGGFEPSKARPIRTEKWNLDKRFKEKDVSLPDVIPALPKNWPGVITSGTEEMAQEDLFIPGGGILCAPYHAGKQSLGTWVFDATEQDELDVVRKAHLQSAWRVYEIPNSECSKRIIGKPGNHGLALQLGLPRKWPGVPGLGMYADSAPARSAQRGETPKQVIAPLSYRANGPLHPGFGLRGLHPLGANKDGDEFSAGGISTDAYFVMAPGIEGPIDFEPVYRKGVEFPIVTKVHIGWDPEPTHPFVCGSRNGKFRLWTTSPLYVPPPPTEIFRTDPDADAGFPTHGNEGGFGTDPDGDQGFGTQPAADQGFGTNTPENPDADQGFHTEPARDGSFTTAAGQDTTFGTDPDGDQSFTTNAAFGPDRGFDDGGGNGGGFSETDTSGSPNDNEGFHPFGLNFFTDREPVQTVRQAPNNVAALASWMEFTAPAFVIRAQSFDKGAIDVRNQPMVTMNDLAANDGPSVFQLVGVGAQNGPSWDYTFKPGASKFPGGSADGSAWILPGDIDITQILDGTSIPLYSAVRFGLTKYAKLGFGDPRTDGGNANGFDVYWDGASSLKVDTLASDGSVSSTGTLWPTAAGDIQSALDSIGSTEGELLTRGGGAWETVGPGTAGDVLTSNGAGATPTYQTPAASSSISPCFFGDGSDGTATCDGAATVTGMSRVGTTYTLTRDVYFDTLTVNGGVTVKTGGYRIHCKAQLTNAGTIHNNGSDAAGTNGGNPSLTGSLMPTSNGGGAGISGSNGTPGTSTTISFSGNGGAGGNGDGGTHTGGAGGTATSPVASKGTIRAMPFAAMGAVVDLIGGNILQGINGGASGGAGGGNSTNTAGGRGGGAGGGVVVVCTKAINNTGTISANGGNGGSTTTGAGAGGGGGGGTVIVAYSSGTFGTVTATHGTGGSTSGTGSAGTNGVDGTVITLC